MTGANDFYVYIHRKADDNEVFYVGKGSGNRANFPHGRNKYWKNTVAKHGGFTVEYVEKGLSETDALDLEMETIKFYRECGHTLTNLTDGGEGTSGWVANEATRERMSIAKKGRKRGKLSDAVRQSMSDNRPKTPVACSNGMIFPSATAATKWASHATQLPHNSGNLVSCCRGTMQAYYGFRWRYVDENGEIDESNHNCTIDTPIPQHQRKPIVQEVVEIL